MLVFLDETGTPNRASGPDPFPVFGVAAAVCSEGNYAELIAAVNAFKLHYWPHEGVILHSSEINKKEGPFGLLRDAGIRKGFIENLNQVLAAGYFDAILVGIRKNGYFARYPNGAAHPYHLCIGLLLERLGHMAKTRQLREFRLIAESRGRHEDQQLNNVFEQLIAGEVGPLHWLYPLHWTELDLSLEFQPKHVNVAGLQLADLVAYALAQHLLDPQKQNPALENLVKNDRLYGGMNYGIKVY